MTSLPPGPEILRPQQKEVQRTLVCKVGEDSLQGTIVASLVAQLVKNLTAVQETWVRFLGWEDPLEKEIATHSISLPGKSHGQRAAVHGVAKSRVRLSD